MNHCCRKPGYLKADQIIRLRKALQKLQRGFRTGSRLQWAIEKLERRHLAAECEECQQQRLRELVRDTEGALEIIDELLVYIRREHSKHQKHLND